MTTASAPYAVGPARALKTGGRLMTLALACVAAIDRWQARRQALRQLYLLDRVTLRDIGLDRSEVQSLVLTGGTGRRRRYADR